jgi:hypothetical protein
MNVSFLKRACDSNMLQNCLICDRFVLETCLKCDPSMQLTIDDIFRGCVLSDDFFQTDLAERVGAHPKRID